MQARHKKTLLVGGIVMLCFHFTMLFINANPFSLPAGKAVYWSNYYSYPYFTQTWALFAPTPQCNYRLFATYEHNGKHSEDIYSDILHTHQSNRLKGYEQLLLAFTTGIHYLEKKARLSAPVSGPVKNNLDFDIVERMAANYLRYKYSAPVKNLKLTLVVTDERSKERRIYHN
jgi:hypothetical protein